jgi:hypothetical protein
MNVGKRWMRLKTKMPVPGKSRHDLDLLLFNKFQRITIGVAAK